MLFVRRGAQVLDLSLFASKHPGGQSILYSFAGKDITQAFEQAGHSKAAKKLADSLVVERIEVAEHPQENISVRSVDDEEVPACLYHSNRRAEMLRRYPEIEDLYGKDWLPWLYGLFCMSAFGTLLCANEFLAA